MMQARTSFISRCCRNIFRMNSSGRIAGNLDISSLTKAAVTGPLATSNEMSKLKPDAVSSNLMMGTFAFATTCIATGNSVKGHAVTGILRLQVSASYDAAVYG
jgi:hypothetical protein